LGTLVQCEELELGGAVIEPSHALGGGAPGPCRDDYLQAAKMPAPPSALPAMVQPQDAQRENPIRHGARFGSAYADHRLRRRALEQTPAHIRRAKAVLQIHGGTQAVCLEADKAPCDRSFQHMLIVLASPFARAGRAPILVRDEFKSLGFGRAHSSRDQPQAVGSLLQFHNGSNQVALFAPQLQKAAPMLFAHRVAGRAHVKKNAPVFKNGRCWVVAQVVFDAVRKIADAQAASFSRVRTGPSFTGAHQPLPALAGAQARNVGGVVTRVPVVEGQYVGKILAAHRRMNIAFLKILVGERFQQAHPADVQGFDQHQRNVYGKPTVCQISPHDFIVRLDGGPIFGERQLEAHVGVSMAIR